VHHVKQKQLPDGKGRSAYRELKLKRKQIEIADLFIAATAVAHNFPFATLNRKHFDRIDRLNILE